MFQSQEKLLQYVDHLTQCVKPFKIPNKLPQLRHSIENAELLVVVVGGFSAGKSTLINSLLGQQTLPVAITPETALPAELRYAEDNYIEAIRKDGSVERHSLDDFESLKKHANEYTHTRVFLNSEVLRKIQPLVLVDMPGFDSAVEGHLEVTTNYLVKASYYVVLSSVEDGNITRNMEQEISRIRDAGKDFTFCLSKTNLRSPSQVEEIHTYMADQLMDFEYNKEIVELGFDGGANLRKILESIDPEMLFFSLFNHTLQEEYCNINSQLNLRLTSLTKGIEENQSFMEDLTNSIQDLETEKKNTIDELKRPQNIQRYVRNVISAVREEIMSQQNTLVSTALSEGGEAVKREISYSIESTLRRVVPAYIKEISQDIIDRFQDSIALSLPSSDDFNMIQDLSDYGSMLQANIASNSASLDDEEDTGFSLGTIGTIGATLLAAIEIPVIGAVLAAIFGLMKLFGGNSKEGQEKQQEQQRQAQEYQIRSQLQSQVLPQIESDLEQKLPAIFIAKITALVDQIATKYTQKIQASVNNIEQSIEERQKNNAQMEQEINQIQQSTKEVEKYHTAFVETVQTVVGHA